MFLIWILTKKIVEIFSYPLCSHGSFLDWTNIGMCSWTLWSTVEIWAWHPPLSLAPLIFLSLEFRVGDTCSTKRKSRRRRRRSERTQRRYCVCAMHHQKKSGCCQERAVLDPMTIREIHAGQRVTHTTETTVGSNAITSRYSLVKDAFPNPGK